jgi:exopolysaccharide production protein ExoQ
MREPPNEMAVGPPPQSAFTLMRSWVILLPLLYYAASGHLEPLSSGSQGVSHKIGLAIVSAIAVLFACKRPSVVWHASLNLKMILAFPLIALVSCLWSSAPVQSATSAVTLLCFVLFAIYISETYTAAGQFDLVMLTGALAVPISILMAVLVPSVGASSGGWHGIFGHKQQCAGTVSLFLITALHWKPHNSLQRALLPLYCFVCVLLIIMSQSRTGWLITLFGIALTLFLWILRKFARKDALFITAITIPAVAIFTALAYTYAEVVLSSMGKDPSLSERTVIWSAVWDAISARPLLGYGYEAFWTGLVGPSHTVVLASGWDVSQAQSGFLDLWLQLGLPGLIALLAMILGGLTNSVQALRKGADPALVRWCLVIIACNLLYNFSETDIGLLRLPWFLFLLSCIALQKEAYRLAATPHPSLERWQLPAFASDRQHATNRVSN